MPLLKAYPLVVGLAGLPLALASGAWSLGFGHWRQLAGFCLSLIGWDFVPFLNTRSGKRRLSTYSC
eukprot:scaffold246164_cov18-Tisochrysis_lutea.AAC.1